MKLLYILFIGVFIAGCSSVKHSTDHHVPQNSEPIVVWEADYATNITFNDTTIYFHPYESVVFPAKARERFRVSAEYGDRILSAADSMTVINLYDRFEIRATEEILKIYRFKVVENIDARIYHNPDHIPQVRGGMQNMLRNIIYPAHARRNRIQGRVSVRVVIDTHGKPVATTVISSSGSSSLKRAAIDAILKTDFEPGRIGETPVYSAILVPVSFRL